MLILNRDEIVALLEGADLMSAVEAAFVKFSKGEAVVPQPGELIFAEPPGDVHIKYGYIRGEAYFVVKIASGFYENPARGLSSSQGVVLVFDARTGAEVAILRDEGKLTDIRTAVAGAIAAKYLAPLGVDCIGVIGAGIQAELQVDYLQQIRPCRNVIVWNRNRATAERYRAKMIEKGYEITIADSPVDICDRARLIVTTTPSKNPLITANMVQPGTHITAIGADTPDKTELAPDIFSIADMVVADSREQGFLRGDLQKALKAKTLEIGMVRELGELACSGLRERESRILSVAVLTGLAVQDLAIAHALLARVAGLTHPAIPS